MRGIWLVAAIGVACGGDPGGGANPDGSEGDGGGMDGCQNLQCMQVTCPGGGTTSLRGIVYAPNGTLPLYNVDVYIPNGVVQALPEGVVCDQCGSLTGDPLVQTKTNAAGEFVLTNVPATAGVPLVIQVGKWRRQIEIPEVPACAETTLTVDDTRLPRNRDEGDIPRIALTTGGADALECLLRKIGIEDAEIGTAGGPDRIHLFAGVGGTSSFDGGGAFGSAQDLWATSASLGAYDMVFMSCEGDQNAATKGAAALQAIYDYTAGGGRVFATHWHNYWLEHGPDPFPQTVSLEFLDDLNDIEADIDMSFDRGLALAQWLVNVGGSTTLGKIDITAAQHTVKTEGPLAQRWIYKDVTANGEPSVQCLSFTTPLTAPEVDRCGRVVFSDIHVSSGDVSAVAKPFPTGCTTTILSEQEKVLAFMLFDIASCIEPPID